MVIVSVVSILKRGWRDAEQSVSLSVHLTVCFRAVYLATDRSDDEQVWYLYSWFLGDFSDLLLAVCVIPQVI